MGIDAFQDEGKVGYQHACVAAIHNIHLMAYALGLGSLWFTFFDKKEVRKILNIVKEKTPIALIICIGKPAGEPVQTARKDVKEKIKGFVEKHLFDIQEYHPDVAMENYSI